MFIGICLMLLHSCCLLANSIVFGRLTALFAVRSFGNSCYYQHKDSTIHNTSNFNCPLGIDLSSSRLCRNTDIILSSTLASSMPSFRAEVMSLVHWLLSKSNQSFEIMKFCFLLYYCSCWFH